MEIKTTFNKISFLNFFGVLGRNKLVLFGHYSIEMIPLFPVACRSRKFHWASKLVPPNWNQQKSYA